jgi:hypothetical protein
MMTRPGRTPRAAAARRGLVAPSPSFIQVDGLQAGKLGRAAPTPPRPAALRLAGSPGPGCHLLAFRRASSVVSHATSLSHSIRGTSCLSLCPGRTFRDLHVICTSKGLSLGPGRTFRDLQIVACGRFKAQRFGVSATYFHIVSITLLQFWTFWGVALCPFFESRSPSIFIVFGLKFSSLVVRCTCSIS